MGNMEDLPVKKWLVENTVQSVLNADTLDKLS